MRSALAFLTILPVAGRDGAPGERLGRAFFPAVGAALGLAAWAGFWAGAQLAGPGLGAVAAVAALALLSGGLHLDGLADTADGLLLTASRERRLEVMRDPRLGAFGVTALVLLLLADVAALSPLGDHRALPALVIAGAVSRWVMVLVIVALPYVRADGLGRAAAGVAGRDLALASVLAGMTLLLDWRHGLVAVLAAALAAGGVAAVARARIGGATGDVYGASCEVAQLAALLAFSAAL